MGKPDPDETTAESAGHDHGVPLTESQRAGLESLEDVIKPPEEPEDA